MDPLSRSKTTDYNRKQINNYIFYIKTLEVTIRRPYLSLSDFSFLISCVLLKCQMSKGLKHVIVSEWADDRVHCKFAAITI